MRLATLPILVIGMLVLGAPVLGGSGQQPAQRTPSGQTTTREAEESDRPSDRTLRIVTFNIQGARYGSERIAAWLRDQDADVVFLQEVRRKSDRQPRGQTAMFAEVLGGYHWISGDTAGVAPERHCDVAIMSRRPLSDIRIHDAPAGGRVFAISATIEGPSGPLRVVSVHTTSTAKLDSERIARSAGQRFAEMAALLEYVRSYEGDIVVAGDFNAAPWMPEYHSVTQELTDLAPAAMRKKATFPTYRPSLRIDYVFARGDIHALAYEVAAVRLSDHAPVTAALKFSRASSRTAASQPTTMPAHGGESKQGKNEVGRVIRTGETLRRPDRRCGG